MTATPAAPAHRPEFPTRHIGLDTPAAEHMLGVVGATSIEALLEAALPPALLGEGVPPVGDLPAADTEAQVLAELRAIASRNTVRTSMIGQGYYDTHTPSVIARNVLENPAWYTAYTPYQPEISQGRLEALLNFQTMVIDLTGMDVAGASMLDESTAVAEAMLLARRVVRGEGGRFYVDSDTFAQTKAVLATRAEAVGIDLVEFEVTDAPDLTEAFGVLLAYPGSSGAVRDRATLERWIAAAHDAGAQVVFSADLLALTILESPGTLGADVVAGTTQRFGVPMGFGGPHAGYLAVREKAQRQLPGRLVGLSKDVDGAPALRLALQTREQHIRREKATSNICTAQVLLAVMASMYAVYHGPEGLTAIARRVHERALALATGLAGLGAQVADTSFFDTLTVRVPGQADALVAAALERNITLWRHDADTVGAACDETTTAETVADLLDAARAVLPGGATAAAGPDPDAATSAVARSFGLPHGLARSTEFLTHPIFSSHRSETSMMRYLRRLSDRDYALDRGMIPLGSCTMKLNAATEMAAVTWPEFSRIHPFAPASDVSGYLELIDGLESSLAALTGYAAVSVQPNAGSQGELAGLLAIRDYHADRGDDDRRVCVVPASAHGTNAASAVLAGLEVAVVRTAANGDVDLDDLRRVLAAHEGRVAAIMVTYPSTHGVYEHGITELCDLVHAAGGQVYIDGANLNALVGVAGPGAFGGDVSHLNLHKTFCIPHGGGGPGVGPVAVAEHLVPFLPGHPLAQAGRRVLRETGTISAAPYGSPSILPISWAYLRLMGTAGLRAATGSAVLSANYVASRLDGKYPVLYRGENGLVAHECILDLRPLTAATGVTVEDVAKRLIDYGFHAPTMSFPVAGTLMVEPTESEDLAEVDRFIDAMLAIHVEANAVGDGTWPADDNPLVNAPHTAISALGEWTHPYSREEAVYPAGPTPDKYWPPVRRVDGAYGDRNLVCACPPIEAYA
ncbi:glycine dehydrogenase (aminomethyl-transferring) [Occultella glacieicola]|uniref:Glycine dehydrogenase (decarboxylating) n=1 Tax=Occultella glacieicola TaxID=2518684 RepID=A0ABY2DXW1_9MICO|nr:aminomethyl-transferring glycine dehydrogenase [Occultella glacieicola]TDE88945.1 glycine dehydrogenase (aminomethyl-transferring) [Occultella glacieicola]